MFATAYALTTFCRPLRLASVAFESETSATLSMVLPFLDQITKVLNSDEIDKLTKEATGIVKVNLKIFTK